MEADTLLLGRLLTFITLGFHIGFATFGVGIPLLILMDQLFMSPYSWVVVILALVSVYILYPYITIYSGITSPQMGMALVIAFIAGLFLLIPSLYLLMRLFLFNARYVKG